MDSSDRRRSPRVPVSDLFVGFQDTDRLLPGNLSHGGIGFRVERTVLVGEPLAVRINLPDYPEDLVLSAIVCHAHYEEGRSGGTGHYYVGARFVAVDALAEAPIYRFVEESAVREAAPDVL